MTRLIPWQNPSFDALAAAWASFYPERWHVSADQIRICTSDHPSFAAEDSVVITEGDQVVGFVTVKESPGHLYQGPPADWGYITALVAPDRETGIQAVSEVVAKLKSKGKGLIKFGQDNGHFFPGCPADTPDLQSILAGAGFTAGDTLEYDVMRDLAGYEIPDFIHEALARPDVEIRRCRDEDVAGLEAFLIEDFPGRWHYDVMKKVRDWNEQNDVFVLLVGGEVVGFAYTQDSRTTKNPIAGCVWNADLGELWGGLGPIGVSKKVRGQKLGHTILGGALKGLADAGVRRCTIDWTTLRDFYGTHGFAEYRVYTATSHP